MTAAAVVLVVVGVFFLGVSAFGLVRFPDFYTRAHVVAKSESLGVALVVLGIMVYHRFGDGTLKLVLVIFLALVANPTAVHALARAHRLTNLPVEPDEDELEVYDIDAIDDNGEPL
ncbi:MAG: monovalent cation/H(+) antiporter subunit G [Acidimicrobiales bacterium]